MSLMTPHLIATLLLTHPPAFAAEPLSGPSQPAPIPAQSAPAAVLALPGLAGFLPVLAEAAQPADRLCASRNDDPFALRACQRTAAARNAALARVLPTQRFYATGTLRARDFDFKTGTYTLMLADIDGDRVPELLEDADVYMGIFLAEPRAHVFPTVYAGTLTCKEARIAELGAETPSGTVGDRYHTIVLDPFTMVSARMDESTAEASPLRDATLSVELIVRLEQTPVKVCCDVGTLQMVGSVYPACAYSPFRLVVEQARAEGLPVRGFGAEIAVQDVDADWLSSVTQPSDDGL